MRLDLYQAESERIAKEQMALLDEAKQRIVSYLVRYFRALSKVAYCMPCKC
jgi:phage gp36-like protein